MKPLKKQEVVEKINKVLQNIHNFRNQIDFNKQIEQKINVIKPFIQKELISAFITGSIDIHEIKSYISFLQENIDAGYFMLISLGENYLNHISDSIRNKICRNKVYDIVKKNLPLMKKCVFGNPIGNIIVAFFPVDESEDTRKIINESIMMAQDIKRKVKVMTKLEIAIGIGNVHIGIKNFKKSYDEACTALRKAVKHNDIIHYHDNINDLKSYPSEYPLKVESDFLEQLRIGNMERAKELYNDLSIHFFNSHYDIPTIKEYISEFITILKRTISQIGIDIRCLKNADMVLELSRLNEVDELKVWCKNNVYTVIECVERFKHQKDRSVIDKVYEYINQQFCKDITLEMTAEYVGLTPQYLSRLFKKEYGMNFIDYIIDKRIRYAKLLLKSGEKSVKEISKMVGYEDANYFCRIFKKNIGLTPKQYSLKSKAMGEI